jgi:hypothetical protein
MFVTKKRIKKFINNQLELLHDFQLYYHCENKTDEIHKKDVIKTYEEILNKIEQELLR